MLDAKDVEQSTANETRMIDSLLVRTGYAEDARTKMPIRPQIGDPSWYYMVPAGFNYIDEKCNTYMRALYDLDRNRDRFKSALTVIDKSSAAIMGVAGASSKVMQVTAQAFGMTSGVADAFVDSYEFKVEPTIVFLTLNKLRAKYRDDISKLRDTIRSPGEAMVILRNYLNICQPNSIEGVVNSYIALGEARSNGGGGSPEDSAKTQAILARIAEREKQLADARARRMALDNQLKNARPGEPVPSRSQLADADREVTRLVVSVARLHRYAEQSRGAADASGVQVFLGPR